MIRRTTRLLIGAMMAIGAALTMTNAMAASPTMRLCTGGEQGRYFVVGKDLASRLTNKVDITVVPTAGSEENLRKIESGECDAAFVQNDAQLYYAKTYPASQLKVEPVTQMYKEYAHLVCNKDSGIDAIKDLYGTQKHVVVGRPGSGTAITWLGFGTAEKRYQKIPTDDLDGSLALTRLLNQKVDCMLFIAGLKSGTMNEIDRLGKGKLKLVKLNDGDLDNAKDSNGKPIYAYDDIPGGTYPNLQSGWFSSSVKTITVPSILVASSDWIAKNNRGYSDLSTQAIILSQQLQ